LCQFWLELILWFWRRSRKFKSLQTDRQTDARQQAIRKSHLSFQLRWAKKICMIWYFRVLDCYYMYFSNNFSYFADQLFPFVEGAPDSFQVANIFSFSYTR
jgi:hypothetical protein